MKKTLFYLGGTVLVLLIVAYVALQFFLGGIVKRGVNSFGPKVTQTKVELAGASLSPLSGVGTLSGLFVGNPAGWSGDKAFYLGQVHIDMQPFSALGDHIVINEITIDQPEFVYETKLVSSNIGDLLKNIESAVGGGGGGGKAPEATAKNGKPLKIEVKKFTLRNGKVTVGVGPTAVTLPMPAIEMTDIGTKEGGVTPQQFAFAVMRNVTTNVIAAATGALLKTLPTTGAAAGQATGDALKKAEEGVKKLFGK